MAEAPRPAFYAAKRGGWRDWWTVLHPPYTAWHLSYVVIGASLAPHVRISRLVATVVAFFLAVGVAAHCLDELHGRPLRTLIPGRALIAATVVSLAGAVAIGVVGVVTVGAILVPFIVVGPLLVMAYNAELFGGIVHTDAGFAAAWGAFPVLTAYAAQAGTLRWAPVLVAVGAFALSWAQRSPQHPGPDAAPLSARPSTAPSPWPTGPCAVSTTGSCWPRSSGRCGPCRGGSSPWRRASPWPGWPDSFRPSRLRRSQGGYSCSVGRISISLTATCRGRVTM